MLLEKIPLYKPQNVVSEEILAGIVDVLKSGWLTSGPKTEEFEKIYSKYIGCKYGVATNSCTSALYLALEALKIKKGDEVVVPILSFVATANVVKWIGAEPIFCDVAEDGEIDTLKLEEILEENSNIKCIIPVHLYGYPCDITEVKRLAEKYKIKIVEDCAQSHGAIVNNKKVGSFGNAGCYSFYATKNITTGEGGIIVTDSKDIRDRARLVRNHCQSKTPKEKAADWMYDVIDLGYSFRMSEIGAVIGIEQMDKINSMIESRREIAKKYYEEFEKINGIELMHNPYYNKNRQGVYHLLVIKIGKKYSLSRNQLYIQLKNKGIITGVHYPPIHYFSFYKNTTKYKKGDFPIAENLFDYILSLPIYPYMEENEFNKIINTIKDIAIN